MFETADEVRARGIHPRHFVDKDYFAPLWQRLKIAFECEERLKPALYSGTLAAFTANTFHKVRQLHTHRHLIHACYVERIIIPYNLLYQVGFTYTTSSIDGDEL